LIRTLTSDWTLNYYICFRIGVLKRKVGTNDESMWSYTNYIYISNKITSSLYNLL
jgi:hypothetical protein